MNSLSNLNQYYLPNTLDGMNAISSEIGTNSLLVDGSNKMLADLDMNTHTIKNVSNATLNSDAVNLQQLNNVSSSSQLYADTKLNLSGGTLTGKLSQSIGNNNIQYGGNNLINQVATTKENVAIGVDTLKSAWTECFNNTAVGNKALVDLVYLGRYNTAVGHSAGLKVIGGSLNQFVGYQAGVNSYDDAHCTYIGSFSGRDDPTPTVRYAYENSTALGAGVIVTGSNQIKIGRASETTYFDGNVIIQTPSVGNNPTTKTYVDDALALKGDLTYIDGSLNLKANITDMNTADNLKLNKAGDTMTGVLTLNSGTAGTNNGTIDVANLSNTYINFNAAGTGSDFVYLRQIGGSNDIHLAFDFHDNIDDGKFSLRSMSSITNPDPVPNTFFYASPTKTVIGAYLDMSNNKIVNIANGVNANDAVNKSQLDTKLNTSGGAITGNLDMNANQIKNVLAGTALLDAVNMYQLSLKADSAYVSDALSLKAPTTWVESQISACVKLAGSSMYGNLSTSESISVGKHLAVSGYTQFSNESFTAGADIFLSINTKTYNTFTVPSGVTQNFFLSDDFSLTIPVGCVYHFKNLGQGNLVIKPDVAGATLDGSAGTSITLSSAYTPTNNTLYDGVTIHYYGLGQYASYGKTRNKTTYRNGEIIKSVTWNYNTLVQSNTSFPDDTTNVWTAFYYTPQSSNSTLVLHADADFYWSGSGTDRVYVIVKEEIAGVNTQKYTKSQFSVSAGGLRSFAPLFPLVATWSSSSTAQRLIRIYIDMRTANLSNNNDPASMNSNNFSITLHEIQN